MWKVTMLCQMDGANNGLKGSSFPALQLTKSLLSRTINEGKYSVFNGYFLFHFLFWLNYILKIHITCFVSRTLFSFVKFCQGLVTSAQSSIDFLLQMAEATML